MFDIESIFAREILDSRGNPTIETTITTSRGNGKAAVPSGASTGTKEALELRDGGERYGGKGVLQAVENVNDKIAPELIGMSVLEQSIIDKRMIDLDGTDSKSNLGSNAILSVSLAVARAAADSLNIPLYKYLGRPNDNVLPIPFMNVLNGGEHAGNELDIQEYMIVPVGTENFKEAIRAGVEVYHTLGDILKEEYGSSASNIGDEGGYAPPLDDPIEPFELLSEAIRRSGNKGKVKMALDVAASEFYTKKGYKFGEELLSSSEMIDFYEDLIHEYPIISLEDPLGENDWSGFIDITERLGEEVQIVGDDIFVTNPSIIQEGIDKGACNCLLLKVNQIGTLTEALDAAFLAVRHGYGVMVSHRSGETEDDFIADLSVALSCGQIKTGAPARSERTVKYNRLMAIESQLEESNYAGQGE